MGKGKRSLKIFIYGVISQAVTLLLGIIVPKLVIISFGSEVNGLLSSVRQIFVYVALLEAGIGTASLQALYSPIAQGDYQHTSKILAATDRYYRRTGILYGLAIIILAFVFPLTLSTELPFGLISGVVILQGAPGVINYLFQGKYKILLRVDGKSYVTTNVYTIVTVFSKLAEIILIIIGCNILSVMVAYFVIHLCQMIYIVRYVKKHYSWLDLKVEPDYKALNQSKNVIIHQISGLIFNNTDILILTYFCGLTTVSIYSLYALIVSCVSGIIDTISSSVEFVLGQTFTSNRERFLKLQETYETYYLAISFAFFTVTLIMLPSFIAIYSRGITDTVYSDKYLPLLFVAINVLTYARRTSGQIINFAGHFKQTQFRSIIESIINFSVSIVMVASIGIYGVLIGTIVALLYRTNDIILYANRRILFRSPKKTYRRWLQNLLIMAGCFLLIGVNLPVADGYLQWVLIATVVTLFCFAVYFTVDSLCDKSSFKMIKTYLSAKLKKGRY